MTSDNRKAALAGMASIPHWFLWRLTPNPKKPGHYDKVPCAYDGTGNFDHTTGQNWMPYDTAASWADHLNSQLGDLYPKQMAYAVGFTFTEGCGYWFIDVDDAKTAAGTWANPQAEYLYNTLVATGGCAFEWSSSGTGYHVFGRGHLQQHRKKNTPLGIELYTEGRGVALGLDGVMSGNADSTAAHDVMTSLIIPHYFPYDADADLMFDSLDFTGAPLDERWRGPADDDDLLRRAMQSTSAAGAFGGRATFAQLWENDPALRNFYEGESEKDMALIAQLAFWTGKNPQRMETLMKRSALGRDKWAERRGSLTWLQYSIMEQCKKPMNVLIDKEVEKPDVPVAAGESIGTEPREITGNTFCDRDAQRELFKHCVYIEEADAIFVHKREGFGALLSQSKFNVHFGGRSFVMDKDNNAVTKKAWDAFTQNQMQTFARADKMSFEPARPAGAIYNDEGVHYYNAFIPPVLRRVEPAPGEIEQYLFDFVARLLPDANDQAILLYYMAACVQHQGVKFRWCPVVQGTQGNGKSTLAKLLEFSVGRSMTHRARSADLTHKFNGWLYGRTLVVVDDVKIERRDKMALEILKPMITEELVAIEAKGRDQTMRRICANFFMSMNDKAGIPRQDNERRYAIFYCAQQTAEERDEQLPKAYFTALFDWLENRDGYAKVSWWLANVPIPDQYNPATHCQVAPLTSSESEIKEVNTDEATVLIREAIEAELPGFAGGWICYGRIAKLAKDSDVFISRPRAKEIITALGYIPHPNLGHNGITDNPVFIENQQKARLWVLPDHPTVNANLAKAEIVKAYVNANSGTESIFNAN